MCLSTWMHFSKVIKSDRLFIAVKKTEKCVRKIRFKKIIIIVKLYKATAN